MLYATNDEEITSDTNTREVRSSNGTLPHNRRLVIVPRSSCPPVILLWSIFVGSKVQALRRQLLPDYRGPASYAIEGNDYWSNKSTSA